MKNLLIIIILATISTISMAEESDFERGFRIGYESGAKNCQNVDETKMYKCTYLSTGKESGWHESKAVAEAEAKSFCERHRQRVKERTGHNTFVMCYISSSYSCLSR